MDASADGALPPAYRELIESDRVSRRTRQVLATRLPDPDGPPVLDPAHTVALRAMLARVLPQDREPIDLAARIDAVLAGGVGDGWRVATQPPDLEAYRSGLDALDRAARAGTGQAFAQLPPERQDALLRLAAAGTALPGTPGALSPSQMQVWFQDVCSDATRAYAAHPRTLARLGYSGIGYGGDGNRLPGFTRMGPGVQEDWEPAPERVGA